MNRLNILNIVFLISVIPAFAGLDDLFNKRIEQVENKEKPKQEKQPEPKKEAVAEETPAPAPADISEKFEQAQRLNKIEVLEQITAKTNELAELLEAMAEVKKLDRKIPNETEITWFGFEDIGSWTKYAQPSAIKSVLRIIDIDKKTGEIRANLIKSPLSIPSFFGKKKETKSYKVSLFLPDGAPLNVLSNGGMMRLGYHDVFLIDDVDHKNRVIFGVCVSVREGNQYYKIPSQAEVQKTLKNGELRAKKLESEIASLKAQIE